MVAHGVGQHIRDASHHLQVLAVLSQDIHVAQGKGLAVPPPSIGAEGVLPRLQSGMVKGHHVRPDLVHVGGAGVVHHVRAEPAAGAHVHLQRHHVPLFAHARLVLGEAEKLEVDEAALHVKTLHCSPSRPAGVGGQILDDVIDGVVLLVHNVHDGHGGDVARLKNGLPFGVDDCVVGIDLGVDKFLHDVGYALHTAGQERAQLGLAGQLVGVGGAHAVVRLDHHRPAHLLDELQAPLFIVHQVVTRGWNASLLVELLHPGLVFDPGDISLLETGGDAEVGAQPGVPLQPILVVGLQPVNPSVAEDEIGHGPVYLVIVLQAVHLVVLVQAVLQLACKLVVGRVAHAQHVQAVVFQLPAELPVVGREVGGNEDHVFHRDSFSLFFTGFPRSGRGSRRFQF